MENEKLICCFCERLCSAETEWCDNCDEYKGLMTIAEFDAIYGPMSDPLAII